MGWDDFGGGEGQGDYGVAAPEMGYYDFQMPDYTGYQPFGPNQDWGQAPIGIPSGGFMFDTTTGQIVMPGGGPLQDYTKVPDQINAPGTGQGTYVTQNGQPGQAPSLWDRISGAAPTGRDLNKALETPLGRGLGAGAIGALGLGIQRAFAGGGPSYPKNPVAAGGQAAMDQVNARVGRETAADATAAPFQDAARRTALGQVGPLQTPGQEQALPDPIQQALREQLLGVLNGSSTGVSPATSQRQQTEEKDTRARLYRQLGQDYELTSPGQDAINKMKERFNSEQYNERLATINTLNAPEFQRYNYATTTPAALNASRESTRRNALNDATAMSNFGNAGPQANIGSLSQLMPINSLLGRYTAQREDRNQLSKGIGDIFGAIAGGVSARRSPLEDYFNQQYGRSSGLAPAYTVGNE